MVRQVRISCLPRLKDLRVQSPSHIHFVRLLHAVDTMSLLFFYLFLEYLSRMLEIFVNFCNIVRSPELFLLFHIRVLSL